MKRQDARAPLLAALAVVAVMTAPMALAQNAEPPSLQEQLEAQYKVAKFTYKSGQVTITEPGTVLVIQKGGILGCPPRNNVLAPATFKDGSLNPPSRLAAAICGKDGRQLPSGEKVYVTKLEVNLKRDKVWFRIIECDSCNGASEPSSYKSDVIFDFPKGSLANPSVTDIEDTIAKVFAIDTGPTAAQPAQPETQPEQPTASQPAPTQEVAPAEGLTNDDVVKMVQVKLADSVIIAKIKSSTCAFDTSTDALVKLKTAGVSDAVLQAMVEGGGQPTASPPPVPGKTPAIGSDFSKVSYRRMDFGFNGCDVQFGELKIGVSEADMVRLAVAASAKGFTYHPSLRYGKLIIGDYPEACRSPVNQSWPLYLKVD